MQKLQVNFATTLRDNDFEDLTLYGDNEKSKTLMLFNIEDPYCTKLGNKWRKMNVTKSDNSKKKGSYVPISKQKASTLYSSTTIRKIYGYVKY